MISLWWWRLLWAALVAGILQPGVVNAVSRTAVLKLQRDACYPPSIAFDRYPGLSTRLSCVFECSQVASSFEALQILPSAAVPGQLDCECVRLNTAATTGGRPGCERWDVQDGNRSATGSTTVTVYWNATYCPGMADAWNPVIDINKCIFLKNSNAFLSTSLSGACPNGSQLFYLKDAATEAQLAKYITYLGSRSVSLTQFWVIDGRAGDSTAVPCAIVATSNATVIPAPSGNCTAHSTMGSYTLFPICEKTLFFPGANVSDILVVSTGSTGLAWFHFNRTQVPKTESCVGSDFASFQTDDMFSALKTGIISKGWNGVRVWIAASNSYIARSTASSIIGECITLLINTAADDLSTSVIAENCSVPHYQLCEVQTNTIGTSNIPSTGFSQTEWLKASFCPLSAQPPVTALNVRTVGTVCFFQTGNPFPMSPMPSDPCIGSITPGYYHPAQINGDYLKSKSYVRSLGLAAQPAWMWNNSWSSDIIDGQVISSEGIFDNTTSTAYYLNRSGILLKTDANILMSVICRSSQEVCNSSQNYLNFVPSTNSCVAVEMTSNQQAGSAERCASKIGGGALLSVTVGEKFNQIRDLLIMTGNLNQTFWINGTAVGANCPALRIAAASATMTDCMQSIPCADMQKYLCELFI